MNRLAFLEKLYEHSRMNIHYHSNLAAKWQAMSLTIEIAIVLFTVSTLVLSVIQAAAPTASISKLTEGGPTIAIAALSAAVALVLLIWDAGALHRTHCGA